MGRGPRQEGGRRGAGVLLSCAPKLSPPLSSDGAVITSPRKIAIHYLTGWFVFDFIASLPLDYILTDNGNTATELSRIVRLPRALRLLRLMRLAKLVRFSAAFGSTFRVFKVRRGRVGGAPHRASPLAGAPLTRSPPPPPPPSQQTDIHPAFVRLFTSLFWTALGLHVFAGMWFSIADQAEAGVETWCGRLARARGVCACARATERAVSYIGASPPPIPG